MESFFWAYMLVWAAVLGFVMRLAVRQRRLNRAIETLEARLTAADASSERPLSEAA